MKREKLVIRNQLIYELFYTMFNDDGLRLEIIHERLAERFYLSEQSVQKIILKQASEMVRCKPPP
jgi:hypothetical protein